MNVYSFAHNCSINTFDRNGLGFDWPTQELAPFTQWYFNEGGASFDLIAHGYSGAIQRVFATEIAESRKIAEERAKEEAMLLSRRCRGGGGILKKHVSRRGNAVPVNKVADPGLGYVLGRTTFYRGYELDIEAICCYCRFNYSGTLFFSIRDRFTDPLGGDRIGLPFELPMGTPYSIFADWNQPISGGGTLLNCP